MRHVVLYLGICNEEHLWTRWVYRIMNLTLVSAVIFSVKPSNGTCDAPLFGLWYNFHWLHFLSFVIYARVEQFFVFEYCFYACKKCGYRIWTCLSALTDQYLSKFSYSQMYLNFASFKSQWTSILPASWSFSPSRIGDACISYQEFIVCSFSLSAF
jgi:hypothetical protein